MSVYLFVNLTSTCCCLLFLFFLLISYFSKKNMNNIENKIYRVLLILNLLCIISYIFYYTSDIICFLSTDQSVLYPIVYFFSKTSTIILVSWTGFFFLYIFIVTNEHNEKFMSNLSKNIKKYLTSLIIVLIISSIWQILEYNVIDLALGIEKHLIISMNITLYLFLLLAFAFILINFKKISKKKVLPLLLLIPIILVAILTAVLIPVPLVFVIMIITLIDNLMYHTIENPDMKMVNELTLAKTQAEQASNAKSDFLSSMSHELRTPLNAIVGLSQMIEQESDKPIVKEDANDILRASNNLLELVDSILDINKIDTNSMELINNDYKPLDVFNDLIKNINVRLGDKPIELRNRFSDNLPEYLYGDKDKIKRIINNLLTNAVKYTDEGHIDFDVDCMIKDDVCNLRITVSDTGRGISEDQLDKLFTKFYRLDSDKDSDIEGAGLGLALTKSLVELMDGKISVNSSDGMGSTFFVSLSQKIPNNYVKVKEEEIL